jgi:hypothetical protein
MARKRAGSVIGSPSALPVWPPETIKAISTKDAMDINLAARFLGRFIGSPFPINRRT